MGHSIFAQIWVWPVRGDEVLSTLKVVAVSASYLASGFDAFVGEILSPRGDLRLFGGIIAYAF